MIEVRELTKRFGTATVVDRLSFAVGEGEILGFLGPNGAGKTTTMRILTGYFPPSAGGASIAGHDVVEDPLAARRAVGYLPESVPLYVDMRVGEYLAFVAGAKGLAGAERGREVQRVMEATGIEARRGQLIKQLSKGFRQRVGLAQALLADPPVLILDEPTIGLDPRQIVEIRTLIKGMAGSKTIILSSHILPEVAATCSRVVIINQGRLVAEGPPAMLSPEGGAAGSLRLAALGDAQRLAEVASATPGVGSVQAAEQPGAAPGVAVVNLNLTGGAEARAELARRVVAAGLGLVELTPVSLSLEEVFVQLTTVEKAPEQEEAA